MTFFNFFYPLIKFKKYILIFPDKTNATIFENSRLTSNHSGFYPQPNNTLRSEGQGQQAKDLLTERRFPRDTDLLTDVSTAKSSMIALTKGAIERKIIEEAPLKSQVSINN